MRMDRKTPPSKRFCKHFVAQIAQHLNEFRPTNSSNWNWLELTALFFFFNSKIFRAISSWTQTDLCCYVEQVVENHFGGFGRSTSVLSTLHARIRVIHDVGERWDRRRYTRGQKLHVLEPWQQTLQQEDSDVGAGFLEAVRHFWEIKFPLNRERKCQAQFTYLRRLALSTRDGVVTFAVTNTFASDSRDCLKHHPTCPSCRLWIIKEFWVLMMNIL